MSLVDEGARIMRICNACRYCEGYCAVFPAMELRREFTHADLNYLANLCHNCGECLYACQYAPPHEFAVNVPKLLSEIRSASYREYALPRIRLTTTATLLIIAVCIALVFGISRRGATFYDVISHRAMTVGFGMVSVAVLAAFANGFFRFWRQSGSPRINPAALRQAGRDAFTLRYLDRGPRRWLHHLTFWGFALCFASTTSAAAYHYVLNLRAPYAYASAPVILGLSGGILLAIGTAGLLLLKPRRDPETVSHGQADLDLSFLLLLLLSAVTGLALLAFRGNRSMPALLDVHLGIVLAFFVTLPYGKFVHAIYRTAALVKYAVESQRAVYR